MKLLALIAGTVLTFSMAQANATDFVAADDSVATNLCMAIASNDRNELSDELTQFGIAKHHSAKRYNIGKKLRCNDLDLTSFTQTYSLNKTAKAFGIEVTTETSIKDMTAQQQETVVIYGSH